MFELKIICMQYNLFEPPLIILIVLHSYSGAGDETLRFWQVFPGPRCNDKNGKNGLLFPSSPFSVLR